LADDVDLKTNVCRRAVKLHSKIISYNKFPCPQPTYCVWQVIPGTGFQKCGPACRKLESCGLTFRNVIV